jgi:hypothetical protein
VFPPRVQNLPKVRAFLDFLDERFGPKRSRGGNG